MLYVVMYSAIPFLFGGNPTASELSTLVQIFVYSILGCIFVLFLFGGFFNVRLRFKSAFPRLMSLVDGKDKPISVQLSLLVFLFAVLQLYSFPWTSDRDSVFASISAFFRILWFSLSLLVPVNPQAFQRSFSSWIYVLATLLLSIVDGSRTYFICSLLMFAFRLKLRPSFLFGALSLVFSFALVVHQVRSGASFFDGIRGEAQLATLAYYGALSHSFTLGASLSQSLYLFFLPASLFFEKLIPFFGPFISPVTVFGLSDMAGSYQSLNTMGGAFLGLSLLPLLKLPLVIPVYFLYSYAITRLMLGWIHDCLPPVIFTLFIKCTPFAYWNTVLWVLVVFLFVSFVRSRSFVRFVQS